MNVRDLTLCPPPPRRKVKKQKTDQSEDQQINCLETPQDQRISSQIPQTPLEEEVQLEEGDMNVRDLTLCPPPPRRKAKKQKTDQSEDQQINCLETPQDQRISSQIPQTVSPSSSMPPPPPKALELNFKRRDLSLITTDESILSNGKNATAVAHSLVSRQPDAQILTRKLPEEALNFFCSSQLDALMTGYSLVMTVMANAKFQLETERKEFESKLRDMTSLLQAKDLELTTAKFEVEQAKSDLERVTLEKEDIYRKWSSAVHSISSKDRLEETDEISFPNKDGIEENVPPRVDSSIDENILEVQGVSREETLVEG